MFGSWFFPQLLSASLCQNIQRQIDYAFFVDFKNFCDFVADWLDNEL